jgi:P27 family predicted phage terminase small subunit
MTRTGRPPKPTKLKILAGNPGKRPLPKGEPQPTQGAPSRPDWLLPEAKREWSRLAPELERLGLLTGVDRAAFASYCQCWAMYVDAVKDVEKSGTFKTLESGYEMPRASVGIAVKMLEKLSALGAKFGLSPSDRARISIPEPKKEDEFDSFLKGKSG